MIVQLCGLSGSGKTTVAYKTKELLKREDIAVEIIDGDEYRKAICADLGFSRQDRNENIRRLGFVASKFSQHGIISIICAINPYEDIRTELALKYHDVRTVYIDCDMGTLMLRDTKGLYKRAALPETDPNRVCNLSGVNDPFEAPLNADLVIRTDAETADESANKLYHFILAHRK